ncbi:SNF1-related protein kinase regulatory subunit beta-1 [Senna tora]|uniref:SNF1-related protein kinase regulatory subunit beta-1 n=1 Tax=Senna tora TaxID=362788 RepID=A0A834T385_9FABA|nr:SNF1-related protein kinase regulatory subunit beta-1 [Senna tora]
MGNANGREDGGDIGRDDRSAAEPGLRGNFSSDSRPPAARPASSDAVAAGGRPPQSRQPILSVPQVPVASLHRGSGPPFLNQIWKNESHSHGIVDQLPERRIPVMITWNHGGSNVAVEGSWDNWAHRKILQRSGKDYSILMVLPLGIYHYKFIVDGEPRYTPDLPSAANEMGDICNLLDVNDYVPENPDGVTEFEAPPSPDSSYGQSLLSDEDFAKEPLAVPSQLHLTVLNMENSDTLEKNLASHSVVALGLTHRFQSKYVTVVLYKPLSLDKK